MPAASPNPTSAASLAAVSHAESSGRPRHDWLATIWRCGRAWEVGTSTRASWDRGVAHAAATRSAWLREADPGREVNLNSLEMLSARHHDAYMPPTHHRHLLNPADQAAVHAGSIDVFGGMEKVQDETHGSGGSAMSDLSALENETDDFGRKLIQHQRDAQRLSSLRENPRAFRKARPRSRIAERLEREERDMNQQMTESHQRASSKERIEAEPPVTVPREWGRKARRQSDWMRKIREPSITTKGEEEEKLDRNVIYPRKTSSAYSGDNNPLLDWDTVDRPLQSIENTPPSMRRRAQLPTPSSMNHMNTTLKPGDESEDGDFNAASLLASTPATRLPRKIDELTRREIENIERRGLTTRALDHIDEISPNATRRTSRNSLRDQALADGMEGTPSSPTGRPISAPAAKVTSPSKIPRRPGSAIGNNKENLPFSESNRAYKSARTTGLSDRTAHAVDTNTTSQNASSRPGHKRTDSMGLLRRLARVSSMSPSPAREKQAPPEKSRDGASRPTSAGDAGASKSTARRVDFATDAESRHVVAGKEEALAVKREEDYDKQSLQQAGDELNAPDLPQHMLQDAQTPVVTGAWVDANLESTAEAANGTERVSGDSDSVKTVRQERVDAVRVRGQSTYRKSALDDIVYQARHGDNTQQYGENTMASLEDIAHPNLEQTDPTITFDYDTLKREQEDLYANDNLNQEESDRRQEDLAVEAMNKHLRAARSSIKDANRGLRRVENQIETAEDRKARAVAADPTPSITTSTALVQSAKPHVYCTCHSRNAGGAWWALWTEFRSLFYTYGTEPAAEYSWLTIRPTWLGLALLLYLTWYLSETTLCSYFCNPRFARWVDDYPDPHAPEFPFVIPTLVFRPVKWVWKPACEGLAWGFGVVFHALFGERSSSVRGPGTVGRGGKGVGGRAWRAVSATGGGGEWVATATTVGRRVAQSVVDVVDEAGSMWDDERLL